MITSSHNPKIKRIRALTANARDRREAAVFFAEGVRLLEEANRSGWPFRQVFFTESVSDRGRALADELRNGGTAVEAVSDSVMRALSETETCQGIWAELELREMALPAVLDWVLIADQLRDPGNLGALLRAAAAVGVQAVFLPPETADAFSPKAVRAGMGAQFRLPTRSASWDEIEQICAGSGLRFFLAAMSGTPCWNLDFRAPTALIVGGEADGAGSRARELAAQPVSLPMPGGMESLNAGVAGGVLLFEILRQRTTAAAS